MYQCCINCTDFDGQVIVFFNLGSLIHVVIVELKILNTYSLTLYSENWYDLNRRHNQDTYKNQILSLDFLRVESVSWHFDAKLSTLFSSRILNAYTKFNINCKKNNIKFTENFNIIRVYVSNIKPFTCNILYNFHTVSYKKSESVLCTFKQLCRVQTLRQFFVCWNCTILTIQ